MTQNLKDILLELDRKLDFFEQGAKNLGILNQVVYRQSKQFNSQLIDGTSLEETQIPVKEITVKDMVYDLQQICGELWKWKSKQLDQIGREEY